MASVVACVLGGRPQRKEAETVGDLRDLMNLDGHKASVQGEPVDDDYELEDEDFVSFAPSVKGGC